jgi:hypothetical protein
MSISHLNLHTDLLQLPVFQLLRLTESVIFWEEMQNKTIHSSNVSPHRYPPLFAAVFECVWSYFHNMVKGVVIFWEALQNKTFQSSGVSWRHFLHKKFVASITRLFACSGPLIEIYLRIHFISLSDIQNSVQFFFTELSPLTSKTRSRKNARENRRNSQEWNNLEKLTTLGT